MQIDTETVHCLDLRIEEGKRRVEEGRTYDIEKIRYVQFLPREMNIDPTSFTNIQDVIALNELIEKYGADPITEIVNAIREKNKEKYTDEVIDSLVYVIDGWDWAGDLKELIREVEDIREGLLSYLDIEKWLENSSWRRVRTKQRTFFYDLNSL